MAVVWPSKNNFANGDVLTATNMNNIADTLNVFNPTSATNGQVWTANGSGSGSFATPTSGGWTSLTTGTFSGGTSTDITGYSMAYKHLEVWIWNVSFSSADSLSIRAFNTTVASSGGTMVTAAIRNVNGTLNSNNSYFNGTANYIQLNFFSGVTSASTNFIQFVLPNYSTSTQRRTAYGSASYTTGLTGPSNDFATANLDRTAAATMSSFRILSGGGATINSLNYQIWGIN